MMKYRKMTREDISEASALYIDYYNNHEDGSWTEATTSKRISQVLTHEDSYCLVLEENDRMIAFAMGYFEQYDDGTAYDLVEIVVASDKQNAGIGTQFMQELEEHVKCQGAMLIQFQAVNDEMHEHFYGKLGYRTARNLVLKSKIL